jgi:hypothetical protein
MTDSKLRDLARLGAEARLRSLQEEQQAIFGMFPQLRTGAASRGRVHNAVAERLSASPTPRRKRMSLAMRKAVGERMRTYWATRRAEKQNHTQATNLDRKLPRAARQPSKTRKRVPGGQ